jgi:Lrp/AsnC family leucine-responsive transcriptional regulator
MIDETGMKILKILQEKARIPNVEVARMVGMAPSAVLERIRKLEKQGIIDGYEVRLNPEEFKRNMVAFVSVKTRQNKSNIDTGKELSKMQEVQEVHFVSGEDCFLIKVRVFDTKELNRLLKDKILTIKSVASTRTTVVLSTYKETSRIPLGVNKKDINK